VAVTIGCASQNNPNAFLNGYIDELRISKGIARWTSNFTPQSTAYGTAEISETVADSFTVGETISATSFTPDVSVSDSLALGDSAVGGLDCPDAIEDGPSLDDSATVRKEAVAEISDSAVAGDYDLDHAAARGRDQVGPLNQIVIKLSDTIRISIAAATVGVAAWTSHGGKSKTSVLPYYKPEDREESTFYWIQGTWQPTVECSDNTATWIPCAPIQGQRRRRHGDKDHR
jgi:hypothetical protein